MPRAAKGARIIWRKKSVRKDGSIRSPAGWWIRDGSNLYSTGCAHGETLLAEEKLSEFIVKKLARQEPERKRGCHPDQVAVADVISVYIDDKASKHAKPKETIARLAAIADFFGGMVVSDINGKVCRDYAESHASQPAARRQLEDLRAALVHYQKEGFVTTVPKIELPEKSEARERHLTRSEAARLLLAAWRMKQKWKGQESARRTGRHLARFILAGLYTGTRSAAICGAAVRPTIGRGYVDLDRGVFHRKAAGASETNKRQPAVRIPDRLLTHMRRWAQTPLDIKTKARGKSTSIGRMISEDFVVEWEGGPVASVKKSFKAACEAAGLGWYEGDKFKTDVTPHVLRHTAATWMMQNGAKLSDAADFLGMTEATLRAHYYKFHPDFQAEAAAAITAKPAASRTASNVVRLVR